eukprot:3287919-Ditylum_brightwellii.AAC.1
MDRRPAGPATELHTPHLQVPPELPVSAVLRADVPGVLQDGHDPPSAGEVGLLGGVHRGVVAPPARQDRQEDVRP